MNWRRLPLAIVATAILVLAATAIPAIGRDAVAPSFDRRGSAAALAKAKRAFDLARAARRSAREAQEGAAIARTAALVAGNDAAAARALADTARDEATAAKGAATTTQAQLAANGIVSASEPGLVTSTAPIGEYEAKGGPAVQVTVPNSGLIEVWAQVEIKDDEGGAVGLYEDGAKVPGISAAEYCGDDSALVDAQGGGTGEFIPFATPPTPSFPGCTSAGAPAPVLLSRPPGPHTYELRYSECSCGGEAQFRNRLLRIAPRP
ncbi:MAG TPA: hypothetical protein VFX85_07565 [Solirubrobacterales bacterium]|nr:hypothetical protein [Solirubrobacterales bacterium]